MNKSLIENFEQVVKNRRSIRIYDTDAPFDSSAVTRSLQRAHLAPNSSNLQLWEFYHISSLEGKEKIAEYCLGQPSAKTANELVVFVARKDLWKQRAKWNLTTILKDLKVSEDELQAILSESTSNNPLKTVGAADKKQRVQSINKYYGSLIPQLYKNDDLGISSLLKKVFVTIQGMKKPTYREVTRNDVRVVAHKSCALAAQNFMLSMAAEGYGTCPMEGFDSKRIKQYLNLPKGAEVNMVISCGVPKPEGIYGAQLRVDFNEVYKKV